MKEHRQQEEAEMNKSGTSLPEQIIYMWLKKNLGEDKVINRDIFDGFEYDISIRSLNLVIEYGDSLYHNYLDDSNKRDIDKVEYAKQHDLNLLRVFNDGKTEKAYIDNNLIVFKSNKDKYLLKQVLGLISYYIEENCGVFIEPNTMDENVYAQAVSSICNSSYIDSFETKYPELARYWDTEKNLGISPKKICTTSNFKFIFKCPECGNHFKTTIPSLINNSVCECCGHNFRIQEKEEIVSLDKLKGLHNNVKCFMINGEVMECSYNDMIYSTVKVAYTSGKISLLAEEGLVKSVRCTEIKGDYVVIGEYFLPIYQDTAKQYKMLIDILVALDIDVSAIKVRVEQQKKNEICVKPVKFVDLSKELKNQEEIINDIAYRKDKEPVEKSLFENPVCCEPETKTFDNMNSGMYSDSEKMKWIYNNSKDYRGVQYNMLLLGMGNLLTSETYGA